MRTLLAILLALIGFSGVLAQTPVPGSSGVTVTVVTGADGTAGNLNFTLSGTFSGDPLSFTLDQPGDLQPGMTNVYSFSVPHDFCELFQFDLRLDGDDWLGDRLTINIDGIDVWYNGRYGDSGALTATSARGGTWDGTDAYRTFCVTLPVELSFVTGANGTSDNPTFYLLGDFSAAPYRFDLNQPADLQPGLTNTYLYRAPMNFCQMTGWNLAKSISGSADDDWLPTRIDLTIDSTLVFFDAVFNEVGPITAESNVGGTWDGTDAYQSRCAEGVLTIPPLAVATLPANILPESVLPVTVVPGVLGTINQLEDVLSTIIPPDTLPGGLPLVTPELGEPPLPTLPVAGVTQCAGAPAPRLEIGGLGRVTPGAPNRLRSQASTSGAILGNMPAGTLFAVIGGPVCGEGYSWWQVNFNGIIGWTVEGTGGVYYLEPA